MSGLWLLCAALSLASCDSDLRGNTAKSEDGRTYLVVADDNGGACGPLLVDGAPWKHPIGQRGEVAPGSHTIECGSAMAFQVDRGTVYTFDYWGP
jgi:hypothetical protein